MHLGLCHEWLTFAFHFHALEKAMATHSSILAWRIPGTGEPGGLPSTGSHRIGHDWSDLAAAAVTFQFEDIGAKEECAQVLREFIKQFKVKSISSFLVLRLDFVLIHVVWPVVCVAGEEKFLFLLPFGVFGWGPYNKRQMKRKACTLTSCEFYVTWGPSQRNKDVEKLLILSYTWLDEEWKVVKKGYELQVVNGGTYKVQMTTSVPPSLEVSVLLSSGYWEGTSHMKVLWLASGEGQKVWPVPEADSFSLNFSMVPYLGAPCSEPHHLVYWKLLISTFHCFYISGLKWDCHPIFSFLPFFLINRNSWLG